jgi:signal transduction histidine kinase
MQGATKKAMAPPKDCSVLVGTPNALFLQRLGQEVQHLVGPASVSFASSLERLREMASRNSPHVILVDDRLLDARPLSESVAEFSAVVPTILVAPYDRQTEVARLIADGQLEFVPRSGEWVPLAASLVERRLRWAKAFKSSIATPSSQNDIGELFRHEINNPLTGILGNAELILAHSDQLPAIDTQRIRTVVELAVRLRETVRRVSNAWEAQPDSVKSA